MPSTPEIANRKTENGCKECYEVSVHPKEPSGSGLEKKNGMSILDRQNIGKRSGLTASLFLTTI